MNSNKKLGCRTVAECHFYCNSKILAVALQKFIARYSVYASKFLLCLAQNLRISLRKRIRQQSRYRLQVAGCIFLLLILIAPLGSVLADELDDALRDAGVGSAPSGLDLLDEAEFAKKGLKGADDILRLGAEKAGFPGEAREPEVVAGEVIRGLMVLIAVIFGILVIYGGYLWMTARGNEEQAKKALEILKTSVVGFILVLGAYAITNYVVETVLTAAFGG